MEQPQYAQGNFPYMMNDVSYDIFAAQFGAHMTSPDQPYSPASPWSGSQSPTQGDEDASDSKQDSKSKKSRGNRYKNCTEAALSRRRAQNRENQRAYRKRKEERILELQHQLDEMSQKNDILSCAYSMLATECSRLKAGQSPLKTSPQDWQSQAAAAAAAAAVAANNGGLMLDPKMLASPKSPERWWSPDL